MCSFLISNQRDIVHSIGQSTCSDPPRRSYRWMLHGFISVRRSRWHKVDWLTASRASCDAVICRTRRRHTAGDDVITRRPATDLINALPLATNERVVIDRVDSHQQQQQQQQQPRRRQVRASCIIRHYTSLRRRGVNRFVIIADRQCLLHSAVPVNSERHHSSCHQTLAGGRCSRLGWGALTGALEWRKARAWSPIYY